MLVSLVVLGLFMIATTTSVQAESSSVYFKYLPNYDWQVAQTSQAWRTWSQGTNNSPFHWNNELSPATVTMTHNFNYGSSSGYAAIILDIDDTILNWGATTIGSYSVMWTNIYAWTPGGTLTVDIQGANDVYNATYACSLPTYYAFCNAGTGGPLTNTYIRAADFNTQGDRTEHRFGHTPLSLNLDLWALVAVRPTDLVDLTYMDTFTMTFRAMW